MQRKHHHGCCNRRNLPSSAICIWLQKTGEYPRQTGVLYWSYVNHADREKLWRSVTSSGVSNFFVEYYTDD